MAISKEDILEAVAGMTVMDLNDLVKAKPAAAKGIYLRRIAVSSTMGAGVRVEPGSLNAA